jgi:hypothetical protein
MQVLLNRGIEDRGVAGEAVVSRVREPQCPFQYSYQDYVAAELWFLKGRSGISGIILLSPRDVKRALNTVP